MHILCRGAGRVDVGLMDHVDAVCTRKLRSFLTDLYSFCVIFKTLELEYTPYADKNPKFCIEISVGADWVVFP